MLSYIVTKNIISHDTTLWYHDRTKSTDPYYTQFIFRYGGYLWMPNSVSKYRTEDYYYDNYIIRLKSFTVCIIPYNFNDPN